MILFQQDTKLMEGPVIDTVCQNWHILSRDFHYPLAQFPTPLPLLPSSSIALESSWEDNGLIAFWSRGEDWSDSSPPQMEETPTVPELLSLANFFSTPIRPLPLSLCFLFLLSLFLHSPPQFLLLSPFLCCSRLFSCSPLRPLSPLFLPKFCLCLLSSFF